MPGPSPEPAGRINAADLILGPALADGRQGDTALLCGEVALTFGQLDALASRAANALHPRTQAGDRVLLLLKDGPMFVAAFLGIMRCARVAVPLNTRLAPRDLAFVLRDSEASVLLIDAEFWPIYRQAMQEPGALAHRVCVVGPPAPGVDSLDGWIAEAAPRFETCRVAPDDAAFWLYSSGTTGTPKAAVHCHGGLLAGDAYMRMLGLAPGERVFASSKLFFAFSLGHTVVGGLRAGATLVLYEGWPDPAAIAGVVERHRPTVMLSVPTMFRNLLRDGFAAQAGFRSVRVYLCAGEALPASLYQGWLGETGVPIVEGIGATETIFMFISGTVAEHCPGATGKPVPYAEVKLLDAEERPVVQPGVAGTAWVKLPSLCRGYWKQPERSRAAFRDGWFRTGDTFSVDAQGWWRHHGRSDDMLKISGQWVSPAEIEECALAVPGVLEAAVVGVENEDGLIRLMLFLSAPGAGPARPAPHGGSSCPAEPDQLESAPGAGPARPAPRGGSSCPAQPDQLEGAEAGASASAAQQQRLAQAVQQELRSKLSIYKCPRDIRFIEAMPRTATGKIQRYLLRQSALRKQTTPPIQECS